MIAMTRQESYAIAKMTTRCDGKVTSYSSSQHASPLRELTCHM